MTESVKPKFIERCPRCEARASMDPNAVLLMCRCGHTWQPEKKEKQ